MKLFMQFCAVAISATVVVGGSASAGSARDLPDLRVLSVFDPPSQLAVGQEFSEEIVVRNVGKAQTQSESKTELYLTRDPQHPTRDVYLGQVSLPKLKARTREHQEHKGETALQHASIPGILRLELHRHGEACAREQREQQLLHLRNSNGSRPSAVNQTKPRVCRDVERAPRPGNGPT